MRHGGLECRPSLARLVSMRHHFPSRLRWPATLMVDPYTWVSLSTSIDPANWLSMSGWSVSSLGAFVHCWCFSRLHIPAAPYGSLSPQISYNRFFAALTCTCTRGGVWCSTSSHLVIPGETFPSKQVWSCWLGPHNYTHGRHLVHMGHGFEFSGMESEGDVPSGARHPGFNHDDSVLVV